jgi:hypothetical protein
MNKRIRFSGFEEFLGEKAWLHSKHSFILGATRLSLLDFSAAARYTVRGLECHYYHSGSASYDLLIQNTRGKKEPPWRPKY